MLFIIIDNLLDDSCIVVEEFFGFIMFVFKWSDEDEVVRWVNNINMGLGVLVWSNDIEKVERLVRRLEVGSIWVNSYFELLFYVFFGGYKWSGVGMDWGIVGLKGWCNI